MLDIKGVKINCLFLFIFMSNVQSFRRKSKKQRKVKKNNAGRNNAIRKVISKFALCREKGNLGAWHYVLCPYYYSQSG